MTTTPSEAVIETSGLTHTYGRVMALEEVSLHVPEGSLFALLGPNGAGKTTLLDILVGLLRPTNGRVRLLGKPPRELALEERARVAYVAEGRPLPGWMRLRDAEAYLTPLYPSWDRSLADHLRERFALDPLRRIRTLSRGEKMKAALLCALAPRPRVLLMDEPFAGMDVIVRDELARGLLETAETEGWTILISSHEVSDLEMLADHVGVLDRGRLRISEPMETLRSRFRRAEVLLPEGAKMEAERIPVGWTSVERAGRRLSFLLELESGRGVEESVRAHLPEDVRVELRGATLKDIFVATVQGADAGGGAW